MAIISFDLAHCLVPLVLATSLQLSPLPSLLLVKLFLTCLLHDMRFVSVKFPSFSDQLPCHSLAFYQTIACLNIAFSHFLIFQTMASHPSLSIYILNLLHFSLIPHTESILPCSNTNFLSAYLPDLDITVLCQTTCQIYFPSITHNITHHSLQ